MLKYLVALILCTLPLHAEEVVLGLSKDRVDITTSFDGSEILIFGAVKRETAIPDGDPIQVIVTVSGPLQPVTVRRKANRFGIWVNTAAVEVDSAPAFYAVASSGPLAEVLLDTEDLRHQISIPRAIRSVGAPSDIENAETFTEALIRIRKAAGQYQNLENQVAVDAQTLFRTQVALPAALIEGDYTTRIFLTRSGKVVSQLETSIDVDKVGLERWLYNLSREDPVWYGLMSLAIAIFAGWGASAAFSLLRN
ncbi:MAG: TIGR02186 family protein [Paracoccaceae bacterium]